MQRITLAYSPDTDDAFMVQALRAGHVSHPEYEFDFYSADIQELNERARTGEFDITAISVAAYPTMMHEYALIPIGASVGNGFGPALVVMNDSKIDNLDALSGKRIAVPGLQTTACLSAKVLLPTFTAVPALFDEIEGVIKRGEVDAGILIHELQLRPESSGLRKLTNLGSLWQSRYSLPLPLGANAIRKSLGETVCTDLVDLYRKSVEYGLKHRQDTLRDASAAAKHGVNLELSDEYIDMYVNQDSLHFSKSVLTSMQILFTEGAQMGLWPRFAVNDECMRGN